VQAQRTSAWADVARRIAHEIKNPLTPIQLSAERLKRRYGKVITEDREVFDQCTDTIIRQVGDIGRMVDEFSSFARMPKPACEGRRSVANALRRRCSWSRSAAPTSPSSAIRPNEPLRARSTAGCCPRLSATSSRTRPRHRRRREPRGKPARIRVRASRRSDLIRVDVIDNGKGLPRENRQRLLEPYMTTREKGTGLGLAIVKKIIEDHGGGLELHDAPAGFPGRPRAQ
jgi:two-component system nitrogen regulation sensor histidine kinase NtrY